MTDGENPEEEARDLPLPRDIDGDVGRDSEAEEGEQLEAVDRIAWRNLDSAAQEMAETIDEFSDQGDLFGGPDNELHFEPAASSSGQWEHIPETEPEHKPTRQQLEAFDGMINQAILGAQLNDGLTLPWEEGIFKVIFQDEPLWSLPELPKIAQATSRDPRTILKRANSLLKYCTWHRSFYYQRQPFPFRSVEVGEFVWERFQDKASYSTLSSFIEAVNFGVHVLGIPAENKNIVDAFTKGVLDQASLKRPGRKQARPLTVKEVTYLEACLHDAELSVTDRYAAGAFLFALFGRCRWSDLKRVSSFELDIATEGKKVSGFVGFTTFSHKTAAIVAKHGLPMPLIAPIWGLESPPWGLEWHKVANQAGLELHETYNGPVLPAPLKSGRWGQRSVSSNEASKWLCALLSKLGGSLDAVSSHSLKCTTLSWLAKAGSDSEHRLLLGHHSTGKSSLDVYSRDVLSAPLRTLEGVLRLIRVGAMQPDKTRSGLMQEPNKVDCRDLAEDQEKGSPVAPKQGDGKDDDSDSSSTSSSASSSSTDSDNEDSCDEEDPKHWSKLSQRKSHVKTWDGGSMFQHKVSKVVHLEADSESRLFHCGITATLEHEAIDFTPFLDTRKCKRCQKAIGEI
eukprot:s391_g6.t1